MCHMVYHAIVMIRVYLGWGVGGGGVGCVGGGGVGCFFFQAEDGIRDLVRSRGLGDVYKRQDLMSPKRDREIVVPRQIAMHLLRSELKLSFPKIARECCLLYTSDAADERSSVDLGGRRIIKKKTPDSMQSMPTEYLIDYDTEYKKQNNMSNNTTDH